ncbi:MAG: virulence-related protein [Anaerovorax sp.]|nr:virulence-related protein [Anaerovorax sp.]
MDRKEIIKALEGRFKVKAKYLGVPSCNYQLETTDDIYTIDREGKIINSEGQEVELDVLLNEKVQEETSELTPKEITNIEIAIPMEGHTGITLRNLVNMVYSKQSLIKKSLGCTDDIIEDDFCNAVNNVNTETLEDFKATIAGLENRTPGIEFDFDEGIIVFKILKDDTTPDLVQAYTQFIALLNKSAKKLKYALVKASDTDNDKFTFRVFLIRLGMVGDKYKITRKVLLKNLDGNSAFRNGRSEDDERI